MRDQGRRSFPERMIGAARLDVATYQEVRDDAGATGQAFLIVLLAGIVAGIGSYGAFDLDDEFSNAVNVTLAIIVPFVSILFWAGLAVVYLFVGTRLLAGPQTSATLEQVARTTGFASSAAFLTVFEVLPVLGPLIQFLTTILGFVATIIAVRVAFSISVGRSIAVLLVSTLVVVLVIAIPLCAVLIFAS